MKVFRNLAVEKKIKDLLTHKRRLPLKGWSVTRLTCCPRKTYLGFLGIPECAPEGRELIFTRGRAHHGVLEVFRPSEVRCSRDGVRGDIDMVGSRVAEIFTTTLSSRKVEKEEDVAKVFKLKTSQLKAYLYMVEELEGDLLVFFLFGDYSRMKVMPDGKVRYTGIIPELRDWTMVFEKDELRRNWEELLAKRQVIEECLETEVPESVLAFIPKLGELWVKWREGKLEDPYELMGTRELIGKYLKMPDWVGEEWECRYCPYAYVCPKYNKEVARV